MIFVTELANEHRKISINSDQIISMEPQPNNTTKIAKTNKNAVYLTVKPSMDEILKHLEKDILIIHLNKTD